MKRDSGKINAALALLVGAGLLMAVVAAIAIWAPWRPLVCGPRVPSTGPSGHQHDPESTPRMQGFILDDTPRMTLFTALTRICEELDPSLQFDFVCRPAVCGPCAMLVNGRPRLDCRTRSDELPGKITLMPLPFFRLVGDLSVDTGTWFTQMGQRVEFWFHTLRPFDPDGEEERMSNT